MSVLGCGESVGRYGKRECDGVPRPGVANVTVKTIW